VLNFIDSDFLVINETMAKHYGIKGVKGPHFRKVKKTQDRRGGMIGQASILSMTSNSGSTNPIRRGVWVLDVLLGLKTPPPPGNAPALDEESEVNKGLTFREQLELHRSKPACISCHDMLDPIGFGLENYYALGQWRMKKHGQAIYTSGVFPDGSKFSGPAEMKKILMQRKDKFVRHLVKKVLGYALGRGLIFSDQCETKRIIKALEENDYKFSTLIIETIKSRPFRYYSDELIPESTAQIDQR
jgi:hypothetical protein